MAQAPLSPAPPPQDWVKLEGSVDEGKSARSEGEINTSNVAIKEVTGLFWIWIAVLVKLSAVSTSEPLKGFEQGDVRK